MTASSSVQLTSVWQKIASAGDTLEIQCRSVTPAVLLTSASQPATGSNDGLVLKNDSHVEIYSSPLPLDLYARAFGSSTAYLVLFDIGASSSGSSGGGSGGAVTVADGADTALGATTDAANAPTAVGQLKALNGYAGATTPVGTFTALPATSAGLTSARVLAAATTNATSLKSSAGNLVNIDVFNVATYDVFLKLYNKTSAPTVGTDTPVWTIPIKAGTGYSRTFGTGKFFSAGISYAITKLVADTDTTALAAGDLTGSVDFV